MACARFGGDSSVGRARALQARGRRFDPVSLHGFAARDAGRAWRAGKDEFRRRVCPVWRIAALCGVLFGHREE